MMIGVDVGYGYTKAARADGLQVSFPSVVVRGRSGGDLTAALGGKSLKHRLVLSDGAPAGTETSLVGNAALFAGGARTWDAQAARRSDYVQLVFMALRLLDASGDVSLGVGLPLRLYTVPDERRALRERLSGAQALVSVDDGPVVPVRLREVKVFPQSAAAYFAAVTRRPELAFEPCAVVDVGYRTTDHMLVRLAPGERLARPDERASGSLDVGVERVYAAVAQEVSQEASVILDPSDVEQAVLNGRPLSVRGRRVDVEPRVRSASADLASEIAARLKEAWGAAFNQVATVLVVGGGGVLLYPHLSSLLDSVELLSDSAGANALGYAGMLAARPMAPASQVG